MKYCWECGKELKVEGRSKSSWTTYLKCGNEHKFQINHGDAMAGSRDEVFKVNKFPEDMNKSNQPDAQD